MKSTPELNLEAEAEKQGDLLMRPFLVRYMLNTVFNITDNKVNDKDIGTAFKKLCTCYSRYCLMQTRVR